MLAITLSLYFTIFDFFEQRHEVEDGVDLSLNFSEECVIFEQSQ